MDTKTPHQNLQGLCRLCLKYLNNSPTTMTTMGYTSALNDGSSFESNCLLMPNLCVLFYSFTSLDVSKESPEFPKYICSACLGKLREFEKFRKKALKSTRKLYGLCKARGNGTASSMDASAFKQATTHVQKPQVLTPGQPMNVVHPESHVGTMLLHEILDIKPQGCYGQNDAHFPSYFGVEVGNNKDDASSASDDDLDCIGNTSSNTSDTKECLVCPMCKETFTTQTILDDHISVFHLGLNPMPFQCRICKKSFRNYNELCQHRQYQCATTTPSSQKHTCPQCNQLFSNAGCLRRHVKVVHEGEKRFACSYCPLRFGTRIAQRNHECRHTGERPFICDICRKGFTKKRHLEEHRQDHETPKIKASMECP